jgi:hypothetical protein
MWLNCELIYIISIILDYNSIFTDIYMTILNSKGLIQPGEVKGPAVVKIGPLLFSHGPMRQTGSSSVVSGKMSCLTDRAAD